MKQFSEYSLLRRVILVFSSGFLTGYIPFASGSFATLAGIVLFVPLSLLNVPHYPTSLFFLATLVFLALVSVWLADVAERTYREIDSHKIVIDEIVGFFITMTFVPFRWPHVMAAFFLFRLLDILKPTPIRQIQRLPGGWGIMADDVLAGVYGCVMVHGLMRFGVLPY